MTPTDAPLEYPPAIFVHGSWHRGNCWDGVTQRLIAHTPDRVILTPDLLGHGETAYLRQTPIPRIFHRQRIGIQEHAQQIIALLTQLNQPTDVMAHSYAGLVLCAVVEQLISEGRGTLIRNLILLDAMLPHDLPEDRRNTLPRIYHLTMPNDGSGTQGWLRQVTRQVILSAVFGYTTWLPTPPPVMMLGEHACKERPDLVKWLTDYMTPDPAYGREGRRVFVPPPDDYPVRYVKCQSALNQGRYAEYAASRGWPVEDLAIGHDLMFLDPDWLTNYVLRVLPALSKDTTTPAVPFF